MNFSAEQLQDLAFYNTHYGQIGPWYIGKGQRKYLGDKDSRACRFCRRSRPEVTFKKMAHVVPQALGNRNLVSYYECDLCNEMFGAGIENDLGNWTKPARTMLLIQGQNGVPTIVGKGPKQWRIEGKQRKLAIHVHRNAIPYTVDEEKKRIVFDLPRDPYTPVAVMKAFVRIGLTAMPETELAHFEELMEWVKNPDHSAPNVEGNWVYQTIHPGPLPNDQLSVSLLRRNQEKAPYPYMMLMLTFANQAYQVPLLSRSRDAHLQGMTISMPIFPTATLLDREEYGHPLTKQIDLRGTNEIRGDSMKIVMRYDSMEEVIPENKHQPNQSPIA